MLLQQCYMNNWRSLFYEKITLTAMRRMDEGRHWKLPKKPVMGQWQSSRRYNEGLKRKLQQKEKKCDCRNHLEIEWPHSMYNSHILWLRFRDKEGLRLVLQ